MALVKVALTAFLFFYLYTTRGYWYYLISWFVNATVIASISWWLARKITRDFLCKTIIPRVNSSGKAVLITGKRVSFSSYLGIKLTH